MPWAIGSLRASARRYMEAVGRKGEAVDRDWTSAWAGAPGIDDVVVRARRRGAATTGSPVGKPAAV